MQTRATTIPTDEIGNILAFVTPSNSGMRANTNTVSDTEQDHRRNHDLPATPYKYKAGQKDRSHNNPKWMERCGKQGNKSYRGEQDSAAPGGNIATLHPILGYYYRQKGAHDESALRSGHYK